MADSKTCNLLKDGWKKKIVNIGSLFIIFIYFYTFCEGEIKLTDLPGRVLSNKAVSLRLEDIVKQHIIKIYNLCRQKPIVTANALGIHKDTLYRKLTEYGIK